MKKKEDLRGRVKRFLNSVFTKTFFEYLLLYYFWSIMISVVARKGYMEFFPIIFKIDSSLITILFAMLILTTILSIKQSTMLLSYFTWSGFVIALSIMEVLDKGPLKDDYLRAYLAVLLIISIIILRFEKMSKKNNK